MAHGSLTNCLAERNLDTGILSIVRDGIPEGRHVLGAALLIPVNAGRGGTLEAPQSLYGRPDLRLTSDDDEDEHSVERVKDIGYVPKTVRTSSRPGHDVHNPRYPHDDHELETDSSESCSERRNALINKSH